MKPVRVVLHQDTVDRYHSLRDDSNAQHIFRSFERMKEILKVNPQYGDPLRKELIPLRFKRLDIHNLHRIELAHSWRMLYTIEGNQQEIFVFILAIMDHKEYNRLLGYKTR